MGLTAKEAAEAVGISKHGIIKSIRDGRLSAQKNKKGEWEIEPSELFRVYDPVNSNIEVNSEQGSTIQNTPKVNTDLQLKVLELELKLQSSEEKVSSLKIQLDKTEEREEKLRISNEKLTDTLSKQTLMIEDMRPKAEKMHTQSGKGFLWGILGKD